MAFETISLRIFLLFAVLIFSAWNLYYGVRAPSAKFTKATLDKLKTAS